MGSRSFPRGRRPGATAAILLAVTLAAACSVGSGTDSPGGSRAKSMVPRGRALFPLDVGRVWTYARIADGGLVTVRAERESGGDWTRLAVVDKPGSVFARMRWRGGDLVIGMPGREAAILLRLPARPRAVWSAAPGVTATVLPDARVVVPAGTFLCAVVRLSLGPSSRETYWLSPGIGFVRVVRETGGKKEEVVLTEGASGDR